MAFFSKYDPSKVESVIAMLNAMYASELVAAEQYYRHSVDVTGIWSTSLQGVFDEHAKEEVRHADTLRELIDNLGGTIVNSFELIPKINPHTSGDGDVKASMDAKTMLQFDLEAENTAIEAYTEVARMVQPYWPHIYVEVAEILGDEYHHHRELKNLLAGF